MNARTKGPWYYGEPGNHQGLVIAEKTGANVAVTYVKDDASFIVEACNAYDTLRAHNAQLVAALKDVLRIATAASMGITGNQPRLERARAALASCAASAVESQSSGEMTK